MKTSIRNKLEGLAERLAEVNGLLADPDIIGDKDRFRALAKEYAGLNPVVASFQEYQTNEEDRAAARDMMEDSDPAMREMGQEEYARTERRREELEKQLQILLLPKDPADERSIFLEVRAGTGGDEAALFAGDLFRMYARYPETRRWRVEVMSESPGEVGGYKEIIARIIGEGAYSRLKFESGAHRVQRVPETESQGRIHTSACTVAIMPEVQEIEEIEVNSTDIRVDTYRASGAGGQHVNKTDSAIRLTHFPTGIFVECQFDRSHQNNKARSMAMIQAKLLSEEKAKQTAKQAAERKSLVGSGDRSERIRTYNFPQGRVTDHRINLTLYKLEGVLEGDLDQLIDPLIAEHQAEQLAALGD